MKIKLVSYTVPVDGLLPNDNRETILRDLVVYCARVSNPSNQHNTSTSDKLLAYLIKNKHWSPLEMVDVTLSIETTRDIARQILRHRSFSFQEFSQRYADPIKELDFTFRKARFQDINNRQNSIEIEDEQLQLEWKLMQEVALASAKSAYNWAIERGIAKEVARAVLPEGLTMSRMYMKGSLRSWIHYIAVRTDPSTQKEHRDVAIAIASEIQQVFPLIQP